MEANERVGGRINSFAINGNWIECGAQWIHGEGGNPLWEFVQEKGVYIVLIFAYSKRECGFALFEIKIFPKRENHELNSGI